MDLSSLIIKTSTTDFIEKACFAEIFCFLLLLFLVLKLNLVLVGFWPSSGSRHMSHSLETSLPCQRAQLTYKPNMTQKESLGPRPEHTSSQTLLTRIHYLIEVVQLSRNSNNLYKDPFRSYPRLQQKTLRRLLLLRCLQLEGMILAIHGFSYAARSSPRFQHYNVPTSM